MTLFLIESCVSVVDRDQPGDRNVSPRHRQHTASPEHDGQQRRQVSDLMFEFFSLTPQLYSAVYFVQVSC